VDLLFDRRYVGDALSATQQSTFAVDGLAIAIRGESVFVAAGDVIKACSLRRLLLTRADGVAGDRCST
jgi:hypothetical protein